MNACERMPVKITPYKHQLEGWRAALDTLRSGKSRGYGLFFEMGCGKSLTAIGIMGSLDIKRALVVAPSSVCPVWVRELNDYADYAYDLLYPVGSCTKRALKIQEFCRKPSDKLQIVIVNYEATWRMTQTLRTFKPEMIICDESQKIKNPTSKQAKVLHLLGDTARYRMCLTGTPIQNKPLDFWSQYRFMNPQVFGHSYFKFKTHYAVMGGMRVNGRPVQIVGYRFLDELTQKAYTCAMRVKKADCLDLPPKTYETRLVEMTDYEKRLYRQMQRDNIAMIGDAACTAQIVLTRLLILQRMTGGFMRPDGADKSVQIGHSKLDALREIIEDCRDAQEKLVIFVRFTDEFDAVHELLNKLRIDCASISGATPLKDRGAEVERFQSDPKCTVFVGQIEAAGTGITLTAAGVAVFYSPTWNYATYMQAQDRTHRIGQRQECHYIHLICPGTVDEDVMRALEEKKSLADLVVDGRVTLEGRHE